MKLHSLNADRRRRRLQLLAERSDVKAWHEIAPPRRGKAGRIRHLIAARRRSAGSF